MQLEEAYITYPSQTIKVNELGRREFPQTIDPDNVNLKAIALAFDAVTGMTFHREWTVDVRKAIDTPSGSITAGIIISDENGSMVVSYSDEGLSFIVKEL